MREQIVRVDCYSGFKADERPLRLNLRDGAREVVAVEDRWYSPGGNYFCVLVDDGDRYVLRPDEAQDVWSLAGYRAAAWLKQKKRRADKQNNDWEHRHPL